jgi:hypothetical protein
MNPFHQAGSDWITFSTSLQKVFQSLLAARVGFILLLQIRHPYPVHKNGPVQMGITVIKR